MIFADFAFPITNVSAKCPVGLAAKIEYMNDPVPEGQRLIGLMDRHGLNKNCSPAMPGLNHSLELFDWDLTHLLELRG